jgi:hypothetical protein
MENAKHTPGPWYRYNSHNKTKGSGGIMICTDSMPERVFGKNGEFSTPFIVCQPAMYSSVDINSKELDYNCCLIAAAPDLLENLEAVLLHLKHFVKNHDYIIIINAEAAISRAKGETP